MRCSGDFESLFEVGGHAEVQRDHPVRSRLRPARGPLAAGGGIAHAGGIGGTDGRIGWHCDGLAPSRLKDGLTVMLASKHASVFACMPASPAPRRLVYLREARLLETNRCGRLGAVFGRRQDVARGGCRLSRGGVVPGPAGDDHGALRGHQKPPVKAFLLAGAILCRAPRRSLGQRSTPCTPFLTPAFSSSPRF
jgi:hypothetical protein